MRHQIYVSEDLAVTQAFVPRSLSDPVARHASRLGKGSTERVRLLSVDRECDEKQVTFGTDKKL